METGLQVNDNTLVVMNIGVIITFLSFYGKLVFNYAELKLKQDFQKESLNSAHEKIRDLEKWQKEEFSKK